MFWNENCKFIWTAHIKYIFYIFFESFWWAKRLEKNPCWILVICVQLFTTIFTETQFSFIFDRFRQYLLPSHNGSLTKTSALARNGFAYSISSQEIKNMLGNWVLAFCTLTFHPYSTVRVNLLSYVLASTHKYHIAVHLFCLLIALLWLTMIVVIWFAAMGNVYSKRLLQWHVKP